MAADKTPSVRTWVRQLSEKDMPVFSGTVAEVSEVVNSDDTSASDVAHVVLRDASLTGRLLKAVNSFHFNPTSQPINTVTRGVMVMGFEQVRALTLSMLLVDNLSRGNQREKLVDEMAQAFHAATQAQEFAKLTRAGEPEDIFVATLLSRLGKLAFWAFADKQAERLIEEIDAGTDEAKAEQQVLGFQLSELTRALSREWHLGEVVVDYLHGRMEPAKADCINAGLALADVSRLGWECDDAQLVINDVAERLGLDAAELKEAAYNSARRAREVTQLYGSHVTSKLIPQPHSPLVDEADIHVLDEEVLITGAEPLIQRAITYPEPDIHYQMTVMQEISATVQERPSIGIILEMVLEGLYRGVGMDRALFAMLNPERSHLNCKYVLGDDDGSLRQALSIDIRRPENVFHQIIKSQKPRLLPGDPKLLGGTLSRDTLAMLGTPPYMIMPAIVKNKVIGVFLADRKASGRELSETDFLAFQQFCQQANMGLTILAMQG